MLSRHTCAAKGNSYRIWYVHVPKVLAMQIWCVGVWAKIAIIKILSSGYAEGISYNIMPQKINNFKLNQFDDISTEFIILVLTLVNLRSFYLHSSWYSTSFHVSHHESPSAFFPDFSAPLESDNKLELRRNNIAIITRLGGKSYIHLI